MRSRLATLVRGSSRPDTVLRSRPAHLRVTVVAAVAPAARPQPHPPPPPGAPTRHSTSPSLTQASISEIGGEGPGGGGGPTRGLLGLGREAAGSGGARGIPPPPALGR